MPAASSKFVIGIALQSGEGQAAAAPQYRMVCTGTPDLAPTVETSQREETGASRDGGDTELTRIAVSGSFSVYLRPKTLALLAYGALGAKAVTGSASPYTHTETPADDQPFFTIWRFWGGVIAEKFTDCKITGLNISGQNGQSLTAEVSVVGKQYADVTSSIAFDPYDPADSAAGVLDNGPVIRFPNVVITLGGSVNHRISQFGYNLQAAQNTQQTDAIYDSLIEPGGRTLEITWTETADDASRYKKTVYDGSGNPLSGIQHDALNLVFKDEQGAQRLTIDVPNFAYQTAPLPISTGGDMPNISVTGAADKPSDGSAITSMAVVNDVASYAAAA